MRKLFLLLPVLFLISISLNATVHTVSNDPNKPAQFTSPTVALAAAAPGDTLYIYGSPNVYANQFVINKSITIIGAGFNTRKDIGYKTVFTLIELVGAGAPLSLSNVNIEGLYITDIRIQAGQVIHFSNISIRNSILYGGLSGQVGSPVACGSTYTNWHIENCFIGTFAPAGNSTCNPIAPVTNGFLVKNSIISNTGGLTAYNVTYLNCQIGLANSGGGNFANQLNCTFNNTILYRMNFIQSSVNQNNQFNNCITYLTQGPSPTFDLNSWTNGASGSAANCIINQNPLWVTTPDMTIFSNSTPGIRNVYDPVLNAGSPAINAGTDGTDIGLTGGTIPYNYLAEPKIPVIRKYQLVNAVVPPSGTVTVNATATKAQ